MTSEARLPRHVKILCGLLLGGLDGVGVNKQRGLILERGEECLCLQKSTR